MHVMVDFFGALVLGAFATSWLNFTRTVGEENVKPRAVKYIQPLRSLKIVVATCVVPSAERIEIFAETGALENP